MVTAQGPKMILAFSFSPYLPAPILSTFPKQSLLFRKDSLIHSTLNVTEKLSTLLLLMYVPSNLGQILKSKERTFHCTVSEPSEVRDCSQVNSSRDQVPSCMCGHRPWQKQHRVCSEKLVLASSHHTGSISLRVFYL